MARMFPEMLPNHLGSRIYELEDCCWACRQAILAKLSGQAGLSWGHLPFFQLFGLVAHNSIAENLSFGKFINQRIAMTAMLLPCCILLKVRKSWKKIMVSGVLDSSKKRKNNRPEDRRRTEGPKDHQRTTEGPKNQRTKGTKGPKDRRTHTSIFFCFFVRFLEEFRTLQIAFKIFWPLVEK